MPMVLRLIGTGVPTPVPLDDGLDRLREYHGEMHQTRPDEWQRDGP